MRLEYLMRGYGLPRNDDVAHPDKADALFHGLPSRVQKMKKRKPRRRYWKKQARRDGKRLTGERD